MALITSDETFDILLCVSFITLLTYLYVTRNFSYWKKRGVTEVKPFFFINIFRLIFAKQTVDELLTEIYKKYEGERLVGLHIFDKPYLMVRDPEIIRYVLVKDFNNFSNKLVGSGKEDVLGCTNLFMSRNPPWRFIRQKLTPSFTSGKLKKMVSLMWEICDDLKVHMNQYNIDDKVGVDIDAKELGAKFTTDIIGTTAFGLRLNALKEPNSEFRKQGQHMFRKEYSRLWEHLSMLFIPSMRPLTNPRFFDAKGTEFLRNSFWQAINERMKSGRRRDDFIDSLIDLTKLQDEESPGEYKLEGDVLVAQAALFFLAGFETSSTAMSFCLYELAKHPELQSKLRTLLLDFLKKTDGKITYELLTSIPYLDMVVNEALRMFPPLAWLDRLSEEDYTIPGTDVTVTKGVPFILPMKMLQNDPKYFPNPEIFDPERFSEENKHNIVPFTYFPLGEGPRNCIGGRLGMIQAKIGVVQVISEYEVSPCKKTDIPMELSKFSALSQPANGVWLNFKKINV